MAEIKNAADKNREEEGRPLLNVTMCNYVIDKDIYTYWQVNSLAVCCGSSAKCPFLVVE